ncbi:MAG: FAD-dependent oxidoreductase [Lentisphaerae bacterium]|nr:FAD-dependent oxidoreductase [Lentisphaerota bacterium]
MRRKHRSPSPSTPPPTPAVPPPATFVPAALSAPRGEWAPQVKDQQWLDENIPCRTACPARTDIPGYLAALSAGDTDLAYRINLRDNVFPGVLGRVCSRPCEAPCRHGWEGLGEPVAICFSKRSAADFNAADRVVLEPLFPPSGKRVAVVGSGPAGLAAARNLALLGHRCTVYEKHARPGGMMNQGIPEFRLPRAVLDREIDQVRRQGVEIICNTAIGPERPLEQLLAEFDAVILAAGTLRPNLLPLEGRDFAGIAHGLPWLLDANEFHRATVGDKCLVIGGGFTAMDCARTAFRLQCERMPMERTDVRVCYRRSPGEMLVTPGEVEELAHEAIPMEFLVGPQRYLGEGGRITGMAFVKNRLGPPDESGRARPEPIPGHDFVHAADTVLLATGQFPDTSWIDAGLRATLVGADDWLLSRHAHATAIPKLFVAGDFSTGATTLIDAIAHAKEAARQVDRFLTGAERLQDVVRVEDGRATPRARPLDLIERVAMPTLPVAARAPTAEVETGFDQAAAQTEASRCYLCHYKYEIDISRCIKCDQCVQVKPRPACIVRVTAVHTDTHGRVTGYKESAGINYDAEYYIDQKECIRCNACLEVCPTECISVQKVSGCTIGVNALKASDGRL